MQRWQNKVRKLRQFLRGWAKNMNGAYKKEKQELLRKDEELDKKAESQLLNQHEWDLKQSIHERITQLLREEEVKWYQRAKTTKILRGIIIRSISIWWQTRKGGRLGSSAWNKMKEFLKGRNKLRVTSLNTIRVFLEAQKLADYHSMSLWWRIFLKSPIQKVRC
jgi:signal recognition particle GTPase